MERAVAGRARTAFASLRHRSEKMTQVSLANEANREAVQGARIEHDMGMRSLLDILDARRELFRAEIAALSVKLDHFVLQFILSPAMGQASPTELGLMSADPAKFTGPPKPRGSWSDGADGAQEHQMQGTTTAYPEGGDLRPATIRQIVE